MSKQFDVLEEYLLYLVHHSNNFFNRDFMLDMFGEAREQLPSFDKFLAYKYKEK